MLHSDPSVPKAISAKLQIGGKQVDALVTIFDGSLEASVTSDDYFSITLDDEKSVSGTTADLKYICLMNVFEKQGHGTRTNFIAERSTWSSVLTAQFLAISDCPFSPSDARISSVLIWNDQISQICHNPDTLTTVIDSEEAIKKLANEGLIHVANNETGSKSEVQIKLDKGNSFEAVIENGTVFGSPTSPSLSFSNVTRFIDNRYLVSINFSESTDFYDALEKCDRMVKLCEFSYGIEIVLDRLHLKRTEVTRVMHGRKDKYPNDVEVYFFDLGFGTRRVSKDGWQFGRVGDWRDALVAPARNKSEFENVVTNWFCTEVDRSEARARLLDGFRNGSAFSHDRLIGACAAFELLPDEAKPAQNLPAEVTSLLRDLRQKVNNAGLEIDWKNLFKQQLGIVKSIRTKDIIQHRLNQVRRSDPNFLPECELAIAHAVKLRNRLIHGSSTNLSEADNRRFQPFLTKALESIFVFSELMECGYDLKRWREPMLSHGNPFALSRQAFDLGISQLKEVLNAAQTN